MEATGSPMAMMARRVEGAKCSVAQAARKEGTAMRWVAR